MQGGHQGVSAQVELSNRDADRRAVLNVVVSLLGGDDGGSRQDAEDMDDCGVAGIDTRDKGVEGGHQDDRQCDRLNDGQDAAAFDDQLGQQQAVDRAAGTQDHGGRHQAEE